MRLSLTSSFKGIAAVAACSLILHAELPAGWSLYGSARGDYDCAIDLANPYNGEPSTYLKSKEGAALNGFGGLGPGGGLDMNLYRGKRIRFTANMKSEDVKGWAGLWMRVDGPRNPNGGPAPMIVLDNMQSRAITGTKGWQSYSVVLDVPEDAGGIYHGILLSGAGAVWVNGDKIEIVGTDVPVTQSPASRTRPTGPTNLGFDK